TGSASSAREEAVDPARTAASASAPSARAMDGRMEVIRRDPLGKAAGRWTCCRQVLYCRVRDVSPRRPGSARTLAESTGLGNGRLGGSPNEHVNMGLCIDKKSAPSYLSASIWDVQTPCRSPNSAAFSAGWDGGRPRGGNWPRTITMPDKIMMPANGNRFSA